MQITALFQVINFLKEKADNPALLEGYRSLTEAVKDASNNPDAEYPAEILKKRDHLRTILLESEPAEWGYETYNLFEKMNAGNLFGKTACDSLDKLISAGKKDYQAVLSELTKRSKLTAKFSENLSKLLQLYDTVIPAEAIPVTEDSDKSTLFLYFGGHLSVYNVTDLERYSGLWDGILSTFALLSEEEKPVLDINSYFSGNITLEVTPGDKTLAALTEGTSGVLTLLPLMIKIRKIQLDLAPLPLSKNVNDLLEQEIKDLVNDTALEKAQKLVIAYNNDSARSDELAAEIAISLKQIFSFIEKGGRIEFRPHVLSNELAGINRELVDAYIQARELESLYAELEQELAKKDVGQENNLVQ